MNSNNTIELDQAIAADLSILAAAAGMTEREYGVALILEKAAELLKRGETPEAESSGPLSFFAADGGVPPIKHGNG